MYIQTLIKQRHRTIPDNSAHLIKNGFDPGIGIGLGISSETTEAEQELESSDIEANVDTNAMSHSDSNLKFRLSKLENGLMQLLKRTSVPDKSHRFYRRMYDPLHLQWMLVSQVVDRICFCLYIIVLIVSFVFYFPWKGGL